MSADFDNLFDAAHPATAPVARTPPEPEAPSIWMAIYRAGAQVRYKGKSFTISHVLISKGELFVSLRDMEGVVPHAKIDIPLTRLRLNARTRQQLDLELTRPVKKRV